MRLVEYDPALPATAIPSMDADGVAGYIAGANNGLKTSEAVNLSHPWTFYGLVQWRNPISDPYGQTWIMIADGADDIAVMVIKAAVPGDGTGTDRVAVTSGGSYGTPDSNIVVIPGASIDSEWIRIRAVANGANSLLQVEGVTETGTLDDVGFNGQARALWTAGQFCAHWQLISGIVSDADHDQMWKYLDGVKAGLPDFSTIKRVSEWDGKYRAFGGIALDVSTTPDTIASVFYHASDHATTQDGVIKLKTSTDDGGTWSAESTIHTPAANHDARDPRVSVLASGRWIVCWFDWDGADARVVKTMFSDNQGGAWSSPVTLSATTATNWDACSGYIEELSGGNLVLPIYSEPSGGGDRIVIVMRSTDAGASWSEDSTVAITDLDADEPNIRQLASGLVVMLIRVNGVLSIYRATATEATPLVWSTPALVCPGFSAPGFIQLAGGDLVLSVRENEDYYTETGRLNHAIYTSGDDGATWTRATLPMPNERAFMYGTPIQLASGDVFVWWSQEWSGAGFYWKDITSDV